MQYFILFSGDSEKDAYLDTNLLGEVSFSKFYTGSGWKALYKVVNQTPELLTELKIKTDRNETLTVEEFLRRIQHLQIIN